MIPEDISNLQALELLDVSGNQLTALPPALGQLASLQVLFLSKCAFFRLTSCLTALITLQRLNASHNRIEAAGVPEELDDLRELEELDLTYNQISEMPSGKYNRS